MAEVSELIFVVVGMISSFLPDVGRRSSVEVDVVTTIARGLEET